MSVTKGTIVLVHGLWMTPSSWSQWIERYTKAGYKVIAPGWPGTGNTTVASLKTDASAMKSVTMKDVIDFYDGVIRALDSPPIIMGHSFGGLFIQALLNRGLGCTGRSSIVSEFDKLIQNRCCN